MSATPTISSPVTINATKASPASASTTTQPRVDIYDGIHRALRLCMADTLGRVGWLDVSDATDVAATLAQLDMLLAACRQHLEKENRYVHPALEACRPGASSRVAAEHATHLESIAMLDADAALLRAAPNAAGAQRLYRHLALFVAENFNHMHEEESVHNQALWDNYDDTQILAIEQAIIASLPPAEAMGVMRWMIPAMPPANRAAMLGVMREQMPREAFDAVMAMARAHLDGAAFAKLEHALAA